MTFGLSGAALGGAIAGAGAIGGALISSNASGNAADTQAQSARDATGAQVGMFNTQVGLQEPWRQAGIAGLEKLNTLLGLKPTPTATGPITLTLGPDGTYAPSGAGTSATGFDEQAYLAANPDVAQYIASHPVGSVGYTTPLQHYQIFGQKEGRSLGTPTSAPSTSTALVPSQPGQFTDPGSLLHNFSNADFVEDPGYQFRQSEGEKALQRAKSASGLGSGAYVKAALDYNQNFASNEFTNANNRYNINRDSTFNKLASVAGIGQTATNTLTGAAGALGGQIGSNITGAGNAQAAGIVGQANALTAGIGQGISMYQQNSLLNALNNRPTPYGAYAGSPMSNLFYGNGSLGD